MNKDFRWYMAAVFLWDEMGNMGLTIERLVQLYRKYDNPRATPESARKKIVSELLGSGVLRLWRETMRGLKKANHHSVAGFTLRNCGPSAWRCCTILEFVVGVYYGQAKRDIVLYGLPKADAREEMMKSACYPRRADDTLDAGMEELVKQMKRKRGKK